MSLPVPFKEFGSTNEALYQEYCFTYREAVQYLRSATGDDVNARGGGAYVARGWNGYGGHVARRGAVSGPYRGVPVKCSLPWRTPPAHGGADDSTRANASARGSASGGDGGTDVGESAVGTAGGGDADRAGGVGDSEDARGVRESASVGTGVVGADLGAGGGDTEAPSGGSVGSAIKRGKNYEKNKAKRERIKALRDAGNVPGRGKSLVSVRAAHPKLDETWAERKVRENKVAIAKLDAQLEKIEKEKRDGTAEKRYQVEANLVQGQLDGAFALVPQQRVVSWAKTVTSNGSSSAGSSGKKSQASIPSVSSGLGSRSATTVSAREKQLEEENKKLRKDMVALEYSERMKRLEIGNSVERRIMHLEDEVRRRDKLVETYKGIAGIRG